MSEVTERKWISARAALAQMEASGIDRREAQIILADRLRDQVLRSASTGVVKERLGKREELLEDGTPAELEPTLWSRSKHWDKDRESWIWATGDFVISDDEWVDASCYKVRGVHFDADQVDELAPVPVQTKVPESLGSRPKDVAARLWDWEPVLTDLLIIADYDGLDAICGDLKLRGAQTKLEKWFADRFAEANDGEHPSETECRLRAQRIFAKWRAR